MSAVFARCVQTTALNRQYTIDGSDCHTRRPAVSLATGPAASWLDCHGGLRQQLDAVTCPSDHLSSNVRDSCPLRTATSIVSWRLTGSARHVTISDAIYNVIITLVGYQLLAVPLKFILFNFTSDVKCPAIKFFLSYRLVVKQFSNSNIQYVKLYYSTILSIFSWPSLSILQICIKVDVF